MEEKGGAGDVSRKKHTDIQKRVGLLFEAGLFGW